MVVNSILCALLVWHLAHAGLALASALAGYVNCGVLFFCLSGAAFFNPEKGWLKFILQLVVANAAIAIYLYNDGLQ